MNKKELSLRRKYLREENRKCSDQLKFVPEDKWPASMKVKSVDRVGVMRSKEFLVQIFSEHGTIRLSVNRTELEDSGRFSDGLTWDDLMRVKAECGYGHKWAVEVLPPLDEVVNVSNMRHIFMLDNPPAFAWRRVKQDQPCQPQ